MKAMTHRMKEENGDPVEGRRIAIWVAVGRMRRDTAARNTARKELGHVVETVYYLAHCVALAAPI